MTTQSDIATSKIRYHGDAGFDGDDIGITDLQGIRMLSLGRMTNRLAMRSDSNKLLRRHVDLLNKLLDGGAIELPQPCIKLAHIADPGICIHCHGYQGQSQILRVCFGMAMQQLRRLVGIEFDCNHVQAIHAGA